MEKKRLPKFRRQEWFRFKRLGEKWRKPRGRDSKLRLRVSGKGHLVSIGYRVPKTVRDLHPSGFTEVLVKNLSDLEKIDAARQAIRIAANVGRKKREQILKRAEELKIKVLNLGVRKDEAGHEEKTGS
ncbi:MAG: 50S ribosomal protein L32e [Candidatus Hadarchaeum sp.]|uniref:50S ribosomal protein L32e n=1 Tax=Candidatus Hadarchaeum sp. TaxID=2883567 RepID=UPI00316F13D6